MSDDDKKTKPGFFHKPGEGEEYDKQRDLIDDALGMAEHEAAEDD